MGGAPVAATPPLFCEIDKHANAASLSGSTAATLDVA
jgi:hypothetical protein